MIPYKALLQTAIPKTLEARLAIMKAIRALAADGEHGNAQPIQNEVVGTGANAEAFAQSIREAAHDCAVAVAAEIRKLRKYSPDQPRVPAGNPDGGRWTNADGDSGTTRSEASAGKHENPGLSSSGEGGGKPPTTRSPEQQGQNRHLDNDLRTTIDAARPMSVSLECKAQYERDIVLCRMVRTPLCYSQAMERYAACLAGREIPPLRF